MVERSPLMREIGFNPQFGQIFIFKTDSKSSSAKRAAQRVSVTSDRVIINGRHVSQFNPHRSMAMSAYYKICSLLPIW